MRNLLAVLLIACLALGAPGLPSVAGDPESGKESEKEKKEESAEPAESDDKKDEAEQGEVRTYTNADLERLFGPSDAAEKADEAASSKDDVKLPDALDAIEDAQARERMRRKLIAETQADIEKKRAEVQRLEQRILRIRNPLQPRPEAEMTPEEISKWQGLSGTERIALTEKDLERARAEASAAEAKLEKLKKMK